MKYTIFVENFMLFYFDNKYFHIKINIYGGIAKKDFQYDFSTKGVLAHRGGAVSMFISTQSSNRRIKFQFCSNFFTIFPNFLGLKDAGASSSQAGPKFEFLEPPRPPNVLSI